MKKILSIITLFVIALVSCKKDDPNPQPTPPTVKETPLPTVSGIYRGNTSPVFTAEFVAIQGAGIGEIVILAEKSDNPMQSYISVQIPEVIKNKDPKTISSADLKGNPTVTLTGINTNEFKGEITILSIKRENGFLGISGKDKDNKDIQIVFPI